MNLQDLKARAYDLIALREQATAELQQVNQQIAEAMRAEVDKQTEALKANNANKKGKP